MKDLSANGTFINGREIGKNKSSVLRRFDKITLAKADSKKIFTYYDNSKTSDWPDKLSKHYIMTKTLD